MPERTMTMMKRSLPMLALAGMLSCSAAAPTGGDGPAMSPRAAQLLPPVQSRQSAQSLSGATAWLNTDHPLSIEELTGRVVVVDFWTSCCINCLQTVPTLERIEQTFADQPVQVVGVHSPKFDEEQRVQRLRDAIAALGIHHPVALDGDKTIWKAWKARAWPTVIVLDHRGRVVWSESGEPDFEELRSVVASALDEARIAGELAVGPLRGLRPEPTHAGPLRYPGKVLPLTDGGLVVADTGHHRVVFLGPDGEVDHVVGRGRPGKTDGTFRGASFNWPQGLAEIDGRVYVADTHNHSIRLIDRRSQTVTTIAGTGSLGRAYLPPKAVPAPTFSLRSPWALLPYRGNLIVALAGSHQIGKLDLEAGTIERLAGDGREDRHDGTLADSSFAQPSALATDGREVFVLDSETSSIRAIDIAANRVRTVVGQALFDFGDVDGDRDRARLQHPIGLAFGDGALWVADSYNSKVKRVDPATGQTRSVFGSGPGGQLDEPAGIAFDHAPGQRGVLVIADTNHHRILRIHPEKGEVEQLTLSGLTQPKGGASRQVTVDAGDPVLQLGSLDLAPERASQLHFRFRAPRGTKVNADAPARITWVEAQGLTRTPDALRTKGELIRNGFDVTVEPAAGAERGHLRGVLEVVICDEETARVCVPVRRTLEADLRITSSVTITTASIPLPKAE